MSDASIEQLRAAFDELVRGRFYGKYEAIVSEVDDPLGIGRVRAMVPAVLGEDVLSGWALPCAAFGGGQQRGMYVLPEPGDAVWIEFAAGDPSRPIWSGCFWAAPSSSGSEAPSEAKPGQLVIKTKAGHLVHVDDEAGTIVIASAGGKAKLTLDQTGKLNIEAVVIELGAGASESLVLGDAFAQLFNTHTHPTGVGPSGPPAQPMLPTHLSRTSKTK